MKDHKIKHEFSAPYSPHQNGTAERNWRTLFDMARCLLIEADLPKFLWSYAVRASAYIRNRCFNNRLRKTPYEAFTSRKPDVRNLHIFGSRCHAYVQNKQKLDARSQPGIYIGQDPISPAQLIYFPDIKTVKRIRCVHFGNENIPSSSEIMYDEPDEEFPTEPEAKSPPGNVETIPEASNIESQISQSIPEVAPSSSDTVTVAELGNIL